MRLRNLTATSLSGCLMTGISLFAAEPQNPQQTPQFREQQQQLQPREQIQTGRAQVGHHSEWKNPDHALATCVAIANQEEIAMAKFAESKAKSQDVKDFAKMLVSDHESFLKKLEKFAPEAARDGYLSDRGDRDNESERDRNTTTESRRPGVAVRQGEVNVEVNNAQPNGTTANSNHLDFVALHRELAENCIRESKEAMSKKEGHKFDECFIGTQIVKHAEMKNKLAVFERHTSGELRDLFASGRQTTERHMKRAEEIMKKLNDTGSQKQVSDARN